ncbi:unnamed protein product [Psylliodes chrysocephalus]|uniref:DNA replication complex GINS protein PSF3 n=1 Tax=Psylliodes chrysocephalus TaxID=3402493 RepID=A0A9P0G3Y0_9CUCU|nr:unnamed protein product [Psylliodes chrysocephala]
MSLRVSYSPNYYSLDDILATQERVPCKVALTIQKMGHLNPSVAERDLQPGTSLELPLWLVSELSQSRAPLVNPELPKIYREAYREILKADACAVDLHKFSLFFYELGSHIKRFDKKQDVHETLLHTFRTRFRQLMDLADNSMSDPTVQQTLDILERKLFNDAYKARMKLNTWLKDSNTTIEAANMVINHKKRKRMNIEDLL